MGGTTCFLMLEDLTPAAFLPFVQAAPPAPARFQRCRTLLPDLAPERPTHRRFQLTYAPGVTPQTIQIGTSLAVPSSPAPARFSPHLPATAPPSAETDPPPLLITPPSRSGSSRGQVWVERVVNNELIVTPVSVREGCLQVAPARYHGQDTRAGCERTRHSCGLYTCADPSNEKSQKNKTFSPTQGTAVVHGSAIPAARSTGRAFARRPSGGIPRRPSDDTTHEVPMSILSFNLVSSFRVMPPPSPLRSGP